MAEEESPITKFAEEETLRDFASIRGPTSRVHRKQEATTALTTEERLGGLVKTIGRGDETLRSLEP